MRFAYIQIVIINLLIWKIYGTYTSEATNMYYIELKRQFNWFEAQHVCSKMNMILVEINSNKISLELITLIHKAEKQNNMNGSYLWTGGIRNELPVDNFVWNSTGEQFDYTNWYNSYPNSGHGPKACLEIVVEFDWQWRNYNCLSQNGFVCENRQEEITRKKFQNFEQKLQTEIEKNRNLQKELQQQQNEHQEQLRKLKEQNVKLEEDLQAEIIKQMNLKQQLECQQKLQDLLQEQIKQLKEEQKNAVELRENKPSKDINWKINEGTTDLKQSELQSNRPIQIIYFNNNYSK